MNSKEKQILLKQFSNYFEDLEKDIEEIKEKLRLLGNRNGE